MTTQEIKLANVLTLFEEIEQEFDNKPDARKKTEHKAWIDRINALIIECNRKAKHKVYNTQ
jgi:hypothetical protein